MSTPTLRPPQHARPAPWKAGTRRDFWLKGPGLIILMVAAAVLILGPLAALGAMGEKQTTSNLDVRVDSCRIEPGGVAYVGLSVTNTGQRTATAQVDVEYRDGAGARLDTDTAYVRNIAPGDTARTEESTVLDASAASITCRASGVRAL